MRRSGPASAAGSVAVPAALDPPTAHAVTDAQIVIAAGAPSATAQSAVTPDIGAAPPSPPPADVPLRALTRYQHDPAFAKFQQKMHQPSGTTPSRTRLRPDDYPARPPKPRT